MLLSHYLSEFYLLYYIITSLIYSIYHSRRYGIYITIYNIQILFTIVVIIYILWGIIYNISFIPSHIDILSYIILILTLCIIIYTIPKINDTYYYLFSTVFCIYILYTTNYITLYLFLEAISFTTYLLISNDPTRGKRIESSINYYILGSLFSCILLYGIYLIYKYTGETNIYTSISSSSSSSLSHYLVLFTIFFKLGITPFSLWVPNIYNGASSKVSIYISTVPKLCYIYILYILINISTLNTINNVLSICIILSIIVGSISLLNITNLKTIIAFSSINSIGITCIPLLFNISIDAWYYILYYILIYTITLYYIWVYMITTNTYNISLLKSSLYNNSIYTYSFLILFFSLANIPPFIGFFPKYYILFMCYINNYYLLTISVILLSVISIFLYIKLISFLFFYKSNINHLLIYLLRLKIIPSYIYSYLLGVYIYITLCGGIIFHIL